VVTVGFWRHLAIACVFLAGVFVIAAVLGLALG
jgi:hypothetical protein